jgi:hypothetical protein
MLNQTFFEKIDGEEKAYWLGFLFADGCITSQSRIALNLQEKDQVHINQFAQIFGRKCYSFINDAGNLMYAVRLNSPFLWNSLFQLGLRPRKSLKDITSTFDNVPLNYMHHFIRGIFDGDGCLTKSENQLRLYFTGFKPNLGKIGKIISGALGVNNPTIHSYSGKADHIYWGGNKQVPKILDWLHGDATIYLKRKSI